MRHVGAVRDEELLDFASLCFKGKSFLIGETDGDTPVQTACDPSGVSRQSCDFGFLSWKDLFDVKSELFHSFVSAFVAFVFNCCTF